MMSSARSCGALQACIVRLRYVLAECAWILWMGTSKKYILHSTPMVLWPPPTRGKDWIWVCSGGFLGWEANEERLPQYLKAIDEAGINITIDIHPIGATHPNTYKITLKNNKETRRVTAISTGGA